MVFLLYSLNYAPELTGIGKYNGEMASELAKRLVDVHIITATPYYPEWQVHEGHKNWWHSITFKDKVKVYRCPLYVPGKVTTIKRLTHLLSFALTSGLRLVSLLKLKPDVLFLVQPTLFCAPLALLYCKFTGAKAVMHIQDFEVDAMFGLGMGRGSVSRKVASFIESWLLKRFDKVSTISLSMLERASEKGVLEDRLMLFPNWADTDFVTPFVSGEGLRQHHGFTAEDKLVLYSGNIGKKQGLEMVLDAAAVFNKTDSSVKFLIVGSGVYKESLQQAAQCQGLENVVFLPLLPWELVPQLLSMADIHLVVQKKGAADAVLPSKLTNILSAGGHAIVTAERHTELGMLGERYPGIYELIDPENTAAFIRSLQKLLTSDLTKHNKVAREYAVEYLSRDGVLSRFENDLKALCE